MIYAFTINKEDTFGAARHDPCNCPVARSIKRRLYYTPNLWLTFVSVAIDDIYIGLNSPTITTPQFLAFLIQEYDNGTPSKILQGYTFMLDLPDSIALLIEPPKQLTAGELQ